MGRIEFKTIWDKSKIEWKANLNILFKIALVLSVLTLLVTVVSFYDLKIKVLEILTTNIENVEQPTNSIYVIILGYIINFFKYIVATIVLIYMFNRITHKKMSISQDFELLEHKFMPLI